MDASISVTVYVASGSFKREVIFLNKPISFILEYRDHLEQELLETASEHFVLQVTSDIIFGGK